MFSKVVWRGHLGVAAVKSARTVSTGKESVSDKKEFFRICDSKVQRRVFAIVLQIPAFIYTAFISFCSIGLILMYRLQ